MEISRLRFREFYVHTVFGNIAYKIKMNKLVEYFKPQARQEWCLFGPFFNKWLKTYCKRDHSQLKYSTKLLDKKNL